MTADTQDRIPHGPTEEAIEALGAAILPGCTLCEHYRAGEQRKPGRSEFTPGFPPEPCCPAHLEEARRALNAAYPLIRERVCQELAEALRKHSEGYMGDEFADGMECAAEFVESYGKADTDG